MKTANFFALVIVAGVSALIGYFVGTGMETNSDQGTRMLATEVAPDPSDAVVATVDGTSIRESDVRKMFESLPAQYRQAPFAMIKPQLVEQMVNMRIVQNAARADKFDTSADYTNRVAEVKDQLLQEYYIQKKIDEAVTEEAIKAEYDKITADFKPEEEVRARHILLKEESDAKDIIAKLDAGGDFVALAKEFSTGPSGPQGGDLGYFTKERMVPEFSEVAFKLEKGTYSKEPVKSQFGWHVILVEDRRDTKAPTLEAMRKQLTETLTNQTVTTLIEDLKAKAVIDIVKTEEAAPATDGEKAPKEDAPESEKKD